MATTTPAPTLQPAAPAEPFGTDEILWWNNGIWGEAGYAIPNPSGKHFTLNTVIGHAVAFLGVHLFNLLHRDDVKFTRPPTKQYLYDWYKMLDLGQKRLADRAVTPNDAHMEAQHATPAAQNFLVYPVPFFGERIRNLAVKEWAETMLLLLSEMMQHSDNERPLEITNQLASMAHERIRRVKFLMATGFFGMSGAELRTVQDIKIPDEKWLNYDPSALFTNSELTEERQPLRWWPTENDLSPIRGVPISVAIAYGQRWPATGAVWGGTAGGGVWPGNVAATVASGGTPTGDFVSKPGQAPGL